MVSSSAIPRTFHQGALPRHHSLQFSAAVIATTALEEDQSAARIPKESSPPFCSVTSWRMLSWRSVTASPSRTMASPPMMRSSRLGMGRKPNKAVKKRKKGKTANSK